MPIFDVWSKLQAGKDLAGKELTEVMVGVFVYNNFFDINTLS